jgi:hypothetical protein
MAFLRENNDRFPECLKAEREQLNAVKQEVVKAAGTIEGLFK